MQRKWLVAGIASLAVAMANSGCDKLTNPLALEFEGTISEDTTWGGSQCPVTITGNVYVEGPTAPTLTVEPGCEVRFNAETGIYVGNGSDPGALSAVGTTGDPITFTSSGAEQAGSWSGIQFGDHSVDNRNKLSFVTVEYAGAYPLDGGVVVRDASVTMTDTVVRDNDGNGIVFTGAGRFGASSARVSTSGNTYGIQIDADQAATIPSDGNYAGNSTAAVQITGGNVTANATWGALAGQSYIVSDNVYVDDPTSPTLTIGAGAILAFAQDTGLYVSDGGLVVAGTSNASVTFTSAGAQQAGAWSGVMFSDQSNGSVNTLQNVHIQYGGAYPSDGCVQARATQLLLDGVRIEQCSGYGLALENSASLSDGSQYLQIVDNELAGVLVGANEAGTIPAPAVTLNYADDYSGNGTAAAEISGGTVKTDAEWKNLPSGSRPTYLVSDNLYVEDSAADPTLKIDAGSWLAFTSDTGFYIADSDPGALDASGTQDEPIVLTGTALTQGHWSGVRLGESTDTSNTMLSYVEISWAGAYPLYADLVLRYNAAALSVMHDVTLLGSASYGLEVTCDSSNPVVYESSAFTFGTGAEANHDAGINNDNGDCILVP
jgi:hypothetical protein